MNNIELVQTLYKHFAKRDLEAVEPLFYENIEWNQMDGFPNGGQYIGFATIKKNVFDRFDANWDGWKAHVDEFLDAGNTILAVGSYFGTFKATSKSIEAAFIHRYDIKNGVIVRFTQYTDTAMVRQAMH